MVQISYLGTKWYKCDLHLHSPESECFTDKTITPKQWVDECIKKGLHCVALTDHNTGANVDNIKEEAIKQNLTLFPGVEITCSEVKVHLLVLFDTYKKTQDIEDFLINCGIDRSNFGKQDTYSSLSVAEVFQKAKEHDALIIPAHIDEFNGISKISFAAQKELLELDNFLGAQVVHDKFILKQEEYQQFKESEIIKILKDYYKNSSINSDIVTSCRNSVQGCIDSNKAIITSSDNPSQANEPKHGLWGIGSRYSWIKMSQPPTIESLRQALLVYGVRIENDFTGKSPSNLPFLWIEKLIVSKTHISNEDSISFEFSPQMTSIIGGRGSGKSSIIRFIIGALGKESEFAQLITIFKEFSEFFRIYDSRDKLGVLLPDSKIEIIFNRYNAKYRLVFDYSSDKKRSLFLINDDNSETEVLDEDYKNLLDIESFSQKQIFEIANKPNSIRDLIDNSSVEIALSKQKAEEKKQEYINKITEIRNIGTQLLRKSKLSTEINDLSRQLEAITKTGLKEINEERKVFNEGNSLITSYTSNLKLYSEAIKTVFDRLDKVELSQESVKAENKEIFEYINNKKSDLISLIQEVNKVSEKFEILIETLPTEIEKLKWKKQYDKVQIRFKEAIDSLQTDSIEVIDSESLLKELETKTNEMKVLEELETQYKLLIKERDILRQEYFQIRDDISTSRNNYLKKILGNTRSIKVQVRRYQDKENYISNLRKMINSDSGYDEDFQLISTLFPANPKLKLAVEANNKVLEIFTNIQNGTYDGNLKGWFRNKVKELNPNIFDELNILLPEDEIDIQYKSRGANYVPISTGSAGQKTAAILTLILSYGNKPLILDQPEDDLENSLIYDLVVEQLKITKAIRQIIVVTHNANIPVNGDSELIIAMDAKSKFIRSDLVGTIEDQKIKDRICLIMEGGPDAFEMRSKRYGRLKVK